MQAQDQSPNRGFARPAFASQTKYLTLPDREIDIIDSVHGWYMSFIKKHGQESALNREVLGYMLQANQVLGLRVSLG